MSMLESSQHNNDIKPPIIELNMVCKLFGNEPTIRALSDIDLSVQRGDWLAITGPSGAGKSTLLNIIGCLDRPTSGSYFVDGVDTARLSDEARTALRGEHIGFIFQSFHLLPYRSVLENVMLAGIYRKLGFTDRKARAITALQRVGLGHRINFMPLKLSGGEKQRVAIARAILGSPSLLLCDEPTGNLDSKSSETILDIFKELNQDGFTLIVITHDEEVASRARHRIHIVDGQASEIATVKNKLALTKTSNSASTLFSNNSATGSGMKITDLLNEALSGILSRPVRMILTVLGIVIGLSALVATLGLTRTAGNRIVSQFDQLAATEIFIKARPGKTTGVVNPDTIPWDAPTRLKQLNGVVAAGSLSEVNIGDALISSSSVNNPLLQNAFKLAVYAASSDLPTAVRAELRTGQFPNLTHSLRGDRVAVIGPEVAQRLNILEVKQLPAIYIGDYVYLVVGILKDVVRKPELLSGIMIPEGTARNYFGLQGPEIVIVETRLGAINLIAKQAPFALRPDNPRVLKLTVPKEPRRVRDEIKSDVNVMFLILGGLSLIVSAIGIANITLVSVMERTAEIGLRRAIGATRHHIAAQFLLESSLMGFIGGIIGASTGLVIVVVVAAYNEWTPVLDPMAPLLSPLVGGGIGLLSGLYPALRAAYLEPIEALRS